MPKETPLQITFSASHALQFSSSLADAANKLGMTHVFFRLDPPDPGRIGVQPPRYSLRRANPSDKGALEIQYVRNLTKNQPSEFRAATVTPPQNSTAPPWPLEPPETVSVEIVTDEDADDYLAFRLTAADIDDGVAPEFPVNFLATISPKGKVVFNRQVYKKLVDMGVNYFQTRIDIDDHDLLYFEAEYVKSTPPFTSPYSKATYDPKEKTITIGSLAYAAEWPERTITRQGFWSETGGSSMLMIHLKHDLERHPKKRMQINDPRK